MRFLLSAAVVIAMSSTSSEAATTVVGPSATATSCSSISITGITEQACAGGYSGNLLNGSLQDPGLAALQALGYAGDGTFVEKLATLTGNTIDFTSPLAGITYVGIHYGAAGDSGGQATSFFRFDAGSGVDKFTFNRGGLSNAVLFKTAAVPEPATWALMLLGFGMIGFAMRKRSDARTTVSYA